MGEMDGREEKENRDGMDARRRRFDDMTDAAAELIVKAIDGAEPDPRILRYITGALKDMRELMDESESGGEGMVIRVEGGAPPEAPAR